MTGSTFFGLGDARRGPGARGALGRRPAGRRRRGGVALGRAARGPGPGGRAEPAPGPPAHLRPPAPAQTSEVFFLSQSRLHPRYRFVSAQAGASCRRSRRRPAAAPTLAAPLAVRRVRAPFCLPGGRGRGGGGGRGRGAGYTPARGAAAAARARATTAAAWVTTASTPTSVGSGAGRAASSARPRASSRRGPPRLRHIWPDHDDYPRRPPQVRRSNDKYNSTRNRIPRKARPRLEGGGSVHHCHILFCSTSARRRRRVPAASPPATAARVWTCLAGASARPGTRRRSPCAARRASRAPPAPPRPSTGS